MDKCTTCDCNGELAKLERQLKAANKMVEGGFERTSIVTNLEKKIDKLEKQIAACKESNNPQR